MTGAGVSSVDLSRCDCLNYCGDDPRIDQTRIEQSTVPPCAAYLERRRLADEAVERFALQRDIADLAALRVLSYAPCGVVWRDGHQWLDTSVEQTAVLHGRAVVQRCARYLLLCGLAEPHPTVAHLVRLLNHKPGRATKESP